jgi:uncharacterized protein YecT (DUF1311 family)
MKPFANLSWILLSALLASCGKGDRPAAKAPARAAGEAVEEEALARPDPVTCEETARTTQDSEACLEVKNEVLADSIARALAAWEKTAPEPQRARLGQVARAFEAFVEEEQGRTVLQYVDGSILHVAGEVQEKVVRHGFVRLFDDALRNNTLEPATDAELDTADAELNRVYRGDLAEYPRMQDDADYVRLYAEKARAAQRRWIRYRDAWSELARASASDPRRAPGAASDPSVAIRARLTRLRVAEICTSPVGPRVPVIPEYCPCWVPGDRFPDTCEDRGAAE